MFYQWVFIIHIATTFFMTGLIWFVQVVHYPLFRMVDLSEFIRYEEIHMRTTSYVVMPAMLLELGSLPLLAYLQPELMSVWWFWVDGIGLGTIWLTTFLFQVPQHTRLLKSKDLDTIHQLVQTNWIRTILWTLRSGVLMLVIHDKLIS
ncbi:MAG: hypothetical protein AAFR66_24815 [Bacteroidota bacterium]